MGYSTCWDGIGNDSSRSHRYQPWRMAFVYTHLATLPAFNWAEVVLLSLPLPGKADSG